MKKKLMALLLVFTMTAGTLAGCATPGSSEKPAASETGAKQGEEGKSAGQEDRITLTYAQTKDVDSLDPRNATSTITAAMMAQIFSALVTTDEDYNIVCDAAESYELIDDCTYKFTLKKGIKFHDGVEMTSEDVKYTMDTIHAEGADYKLKSDFSFMYCEPIDDYTMYIKTDEPNASTLLRLNYIKIIPKHYVEQVGDSEFNAKPIGSGPYRMVEWNKDASIKLEAFSDYFGTKPAADELICKVIPEASARIAALEAGEVDLISAVTTSQISRLNSLGNIEVVSKPTTRTVYYTMNSFGDSPVTDLKVRQETSPFATRATSYRACWTAMVSPVIHWRSRCLRAMMSRSGDMNTIRRQQKRSSLKQATRTASRWKWRVLSQDSAMQPISHRLWEPSWQKWE